MALLLAGMVIIVGLSMYATMLLLRLRQQTIRQRAEQQAQEHARAHKQQQLLGDIRYIAQAMSEDRCELSEGVYRIAKLFALLSLTEVVAEQFPALFQHFEVIKEHPIKEQRQSLAKQQRMRLDMQRLKSESALGASILAEAKQLAVFELRRH